MYRFQLSMFLKRTCYLFCALYIVFIPVQFNFFPYQQTISDGLFGNLIQLLADIFSVELKNVSISSDSASTYILLFILLVISLLFSVITEFSNRLKEKTESVHNILRTIFIYYLSLQLFKYGFDKVFKYQFYLPEPNILYTPVGNLSKDFLYWTSMGTSYWYSVFAGLIEIIPACLLLFKKTRVIGLLISTMVLINVIAINIGFDISVKAHSTFLFILTLLLLQPQFKQLYNLFILQQTGHITTASYIQIHFNNPSIAPTLKTLLISLLLLESLYPYATARNFNDDTANRPYLHGAYQINEIVPISTDSLPPLALKRFFVHRSGYLIFQNKKDQMQDLKLSIDSVKKEFTVTDYHKNTVNLRYSYTSNDSLLNLQFFNGKNEYLLKTKALNWRKLPALQNNFHWSIDTY